MANSSDSKYKNQVQTKIIDDLNLQTNTSLYFAQVTKSAMKNSFSVDFTSKEYEGWEISGWSEESDLR